jgi:two-component system phosphate regulon sensor histidine kinase PhoR
MPSSQNFTTKKNIRMQNRAAMLSDVLFMSIGEGAFVVDERGFVVRVNQPALDILGYEAEELVGKWFHDVVIATDAEDVPIANLDRPMTEVFLSGQTIARKVYYRRKNGSLVPVALNVAPIMHEGKPLGAIELFRDITDELQLERAKDEFISIASHQLRTPATVVKQYLGMILEGYITEEKHMEMLQIAYDHNNNQLEIINDLLKVAQIESKTLATNRKDTDIADMLRGIVQSQTPYYKERNMRLVFEPPQESAIVEVDPLHMQMVFENLIDNANKYSMPSSTVHVRVTQTPKSVTVKVEDQGVGIDPDDISKLFKKFSRIDNSASTVGGTGLGLYWAKKLIELYDGQIKVKSTLGKGTTFSVVLPREGRA